MREVINDGDRMVPRDRCAAMWLAHAFCDVENIPGYVDCTQSLLTS